MKFRFFSSFFHCLAYIVHEKQADIVSFLTRSVALLNVFDYHHQHQIGESFITNRSQNKQLGMSYMYAYMYVLLYSQWKP